MSVIRVEKPIGRSAATVWPLLADFGSIDYFNPYVSESRILDGAPESGLGAERHCDFADGSNWVRERVVDWRPGAGYTVDIYEGTMPIEKITTSLGVQPAAGDRSVGFMEMRYTPKFGLLGRIMDALMLRRMITKTLAGVLDGLAQKAEASPAPAAVPERQAA